MRKRSQCSLILLLDSGRYSLRGPTLPCLVPQPDRRSKGNLPWANAMPVFCLAKAPSSTRMPWKTHSHRNEISGRGRMTLRCRVGGFSQVQQPRSLLAKAQKHFLLHGAHLLPRSTHSWSMSTTCKAWLSTEHPQPEHEIAAVTAPGG